MIPTAAVPLTEDEFRQAAMHMFPTAADATLVHLYPMVIDLREMAAVISALAMDPSLPLSETASREVSG